MLEVEASNADASGYEPVWNNDSLVGFVIRRIYPYSKQSLAMALINSDLAKEDQNLKCMSLALRKATKVIEMSPYDPEGSCACLRK